ncbi:ubiquitin modifier [Trichuris trichiura]|uniref:Ubiquitin modifier n=1 Tax=Trichuris trichiura TaxID=36087 RepID=A0A077ZG56_TRITR|nr:ubiquitin modifier [Trichuris trichiura]
MDPLKGTESVSSGDDSYLITIEDSANGEKVRVKVCGNTEMYKVFKAFCNKSNRNMDGVRFMYNGKRIDGKETAVSLGLDKQADITAASVQIGGAS